MDRVLEEAAYAGDLALLRRLLQEDRLLLHRQAIAASGEGPLLIAASLGHVEFVHEMLGRNPELARRCNGEGRSALHLASAQGHLLIIRELLSSEVSTELCLLRDNDGFMPIHTAALHGRIDVLRELLDACFELTRALTSNGDSILHLAVKSNKSETLQFLLDRSDVDDDQVNLKDGKGNTILHLAVARKQFQTVKLLLDQQRIEVNALNIRNNTALDVLLDSPNQHGDLLLGELIRSVGGKTATEQGIVAQPSLPNSGVIASRIRLNNDAHNTTRSHSKEKYNNKPGTLMVVATLIATITFTAGLNPPGGFKQEHDAAPPSYSSGNDTIQYYFAYKYCSQPGQALLCNKLRLFLAFDMVGLFASLSIILLLICCVPRRRKMVMGILKWILWLAVFSTALAFFVVILLIYDAPFLFYILWCWFVILSMFIAWICFRVMRYLLRKGGCWKKKKSRVGENQRGPSKCVDITTKIVVSVLILILLAILCYASVPVALYARFNEWLNR